MQIKGLVFAREAIAAKRPLFMAQKPIDQFILKNIPDTELARMLSEENITQINKSRFNNHTFGEVTSLEIDGKTLPARYLNSGGTKEAYEVIIDGERTIFAICNATDRPVDQIRKWTGVLNEPKNTKFIHNLGLCTNNHSSIYPVKIYGHDFPALRMSPYSELPYKIIDGKRSGEAFDEMLDGLNDEKILKTLGTTIKDLQIVVKQKLTLGDDSINLCQDSKAWRLFINDLPYENIASSELTPTQSAKEYASILLRRYLNLFSSNAQNETLYLKDILNPKNPQFDSLRDKIATKILEGLD